MNGTIIENNNKIISRREFLKTTSIVYVGAVLMPNLLYSKSEPVVDDLRRLNLYNINTFEYLDITYYKNGKYLDKGLSQINQIMADRRSGEVITMNTDLLNTLYKIQTLSNSDKPIDIISAYRSPTTNSKLTESKRGVATHSYHTLGQAADINIKGLSLVRIREIAETLQAGGVGYYPGSDFIHVDVGPLRTWRG